MSTANLSITTPLCQCSHALFVGFGYRNVERYLKDLPKLDIAHAQEANIQQTGPVL